MIKIALGYTFAFLTATAVIVGDYFIKVAADNALSVFSRPFLTGSSFYVISAIMWYGSMRYVSLAQAGVAYSMLTLLAVCIMAAVVFGEDIGRREILGIGLALLSMILMMRVV
jgi:undecaprenyl phosphate-alpha-L-ara4N flippase subunit ArnF